MLAREVHPFASLLEEWDRISLALREEFGSTISLAVMLLSVSFRFGDRGRSSNRNNSLGRFLSTCGRELTVSTADCTARCRQDSCHEVCRNTR